METDVFSLENAKTLLDEKKYAEMYKDAPYVCQTPLLPFPSQKKNLLPREMIYPFNSVLLK